MNPMHNSFSNSEPTFTSDSEVPDNTSIIQGPPPCNPYTTLTGTERWEILREKTEQTWEKRENDRDFIIKRGSWWLENGEVGINDDVTSARLRLLREAISDTEHVTPQSANTNAGRLRIAGTLYGLLTHFGQYYTDDEISVICDFMKKYPPSSERDVAINILKTEAVAKRNLGGEYALPLYEKCLHSYDMLDRKFEKFGFDKGRAEAWLNRVEYADEDSPLMRILSMRQAAPLSIGEFGLEDFITECLIQQITPLGINELIQINRAIPTSDLNKFKRNRVDSSALESIYLINHEFIHNQAPGAHELLSAMIDYYDAYHPIQSDGDVSPQQQMIQKTAEDRLSDTLERLQQIHDDYYHISDNIFILDLYDEPCYGYDYFTNGMVQDEIAIDVLRRLHKNTEPGNISIPQTNCEELNNLIGAATIAEHPDGTQSANLSSAGELVRYLNQNLLLKRHGMRNLELPEVYAIIYAERVATVAIRSISQKDWRELFYDPSFKDIVLFRDLTNSYDDIIVSKNSDDGPYLVKEFEYFWQSFSKPPIDASDEKCAEQYMLLFEHVSVQIEKLVAYYRTHGWPNFAANSWSGDLNHALMNLTAMPKGKTLRERADDWLLAPRAAIKEKPPLSPVE